MAQPANSAARLRPFHHDLDTALADARLVSQSLTAVHDLMHGDSANRAESFTFARPHDVMALLSLLSQQLSSALDRADSAREVA